MSRITYNAQPLSLIQTSAFSHETMWSEDHTDYLYSHVHIEVHAVLNAALPPAAPGENPGLILVGIRSLLSMPRQHLVFDDGVNPLIDVTGVTHAVGGSTQLDVKNGPFPTVLSVTQINPATTFLIVWAVDTYIYECNFGQVPFILSHRWIERQGYDENFRRTYSRQGRIYAKSVPPVPGQPTDRDGRVVTQVPLRRGFRRDHSEYTMAEDGLSLQYQVIDIEVHRQAPPDATRADGWAVVTMPRGAILEYDITVHLWGAPGGDQFNLMNIAITIAVAKLQLPILPIPNLPPDDKSVDDTQRRKLAAGVGAAGLAATVRQLLGLQGGSRGDLAPGAQAQPAERGKNKPFMRLIGGALRQRLYDNEVEVNLHAQAGVPPLLHATGAIANLPPFLTLPPAWSPIQGDGPLPQPGSAITLWANQLADPCLQQTVATGKQSPQQPAGGLTNNWIPPLPGQSILRTVTNLPSTGRDLYASLPGGMYTDYQIRTYHRDLTTIEQLPTARPAGPGQSLASIVQIADPIGDLVVEWTAECVYSEPACPHWDIQDGNAFLKERQVHSEATTPSADGQSMASRISGKYVYALADAARAVLVAGLFPWLDRAAAPTAVLNPGVFQQGILTGLGAAQELPAADPQGS